MSEALVSSRMRYTGSERPGLQAPIIRSNSRNPEQFSREESIGHLISILNGYIRTIGYFNIFGTETETNVIVHIVYKMRIPTFEYTVRKLYNETT
ncbi:hypothetical protein NPIL_477951 [Nephila pilipes]|uniref:Uncharacterized protein n=1 Tax=Nephila pilipes TaxID=299642 RepID=A0A8X6PU64_NEPPI|nr:hypothetical protein NPIL_477951 [Nephila pilipes]